MRILILLISIILVTVSYADSDILTEEELQYLQDNPEIVFVSQTSYPPFEFIDDSGERQGMCIELARWISTEFGFQAAFVDMNFQDAQNAILNGNADVLTSFFYSPARDDFFDFTEPMYEIPARIFVLPENENISDITDLAGKRVAVQRGDYAIDFLHNEEIDCILIQTDNFVDGIHLLLEGEVEALVGDEQIVYFHIYNHHDSHEIKAVGDTLYTGLNCMATTNENLILASIISKGITHANELGIIDGISEKWQGHPIQIAKEAHFRYLNHLLVIFGLILIGAVLVFLWNMKLRQVVEQKTKHLKDSEERLHQTLYQANLGSWDYNMLTGKTTNNSRYSTMLGYGHGEIDTSNNGWLNLVHPDDKNHIESTMQGFLKNDSGQFQCEFRMRSKSGNWISIYSCGGVTERDANGNPVRFSGIHQDITRRKHSENMVRKAAKNWESTFDALPELIAILDSEGIIIRANTAQARALGMKREDCVGKKLCGMLHTQEFIGQCISTIISSDTSLPISKEVTFQKIEGTFEVVLVPVQDTHEETIRIIHVARNITERKDAEKKQREMENRVQHSQKLESLGVLAGGIAHDFNNILMAIRGYTELAMSASDKNDSVFDFLEKTIKSIGVASELSGQMLAYSGKGNFVIEPAQVNDIIENMKPMFQVSVSRKANLIFNLRENNPDVLVDSTQMEQVILNLVTNASEALGSSKGTIIISTGTEITQIPDCDSNEKNKNFVFFKVEDTGEGMTEEVKNKLFEPFFSTKFTGRGLGMAVVQGIVDGHNGFIKVITKIGTGSSLKIYIPALQGEPVRYKKLLQSSVEENSKKSSQGILMVDDEKNILFIGELALKKSGYTVFTAENGEDAVSIYNKNKAQIDCIVLDLTMPVMDGIECLKELTKINPTVKVILSSGYNKQDVEERIDSSYISDYLKKPYGLKALRSIVKEVLEG